jgi:hypothetical protein
MTCTVARLGIGRWSPLTSMGRHRAAMQIEEGEGIMVMLCSTALPVDPAPVRNSWI